MTFNDRIRLAQDFSPDSDKLLSTLDGLKPEAWTPPERCPAAGDRAADGVPRKTARLSCLFEWYDEGSQSNKEVVVRRATGLR